VGTRYRMICIATTEMNRAAYRSVEAAEASNDMAAGKESGAIEFSARVMLSLRSVKGPASAHLAVYLVAHQGDGSRDIRSALRLALGTCPKDLADDAVKLLVEAGAVLSPEVANGQNKPHWLVGCNVPPEVMAEVPSHRRGDVAAARPPTPEAP
jgi:hypothetical protein